ncbi:hypothetical protein EVAR_37051_1 [Eumeta japonica]|uniref:Uncharacterized protein n=1 Tax=Eumeta variegata TaxID=151549 RepID=A0A4C1WEW6_EUMVA|nr:hypothetical protein EVAR_37051_1 [Eumeta japonica]
MKQVQFGEKKRYERTVRPFLHEPPAPRSTRTFKKPLRILQCNFLLAPELTRLSTPIRIPLSFAISDLPSITILVLSRDDGRWRDCALLARLGSPSDSDSCASPHFKVQSVPLN